MHTEKRTGGRGAPHDPPKKTLKNVTPKLHSPKYLTFAVLPNLQTFAKSLFEKNVTLLAKFGRVMSESCKWHASENFFKNAIFWARVLPNRMEATSEIECPSVCLSLSVSLSLSLSLSRSLSPGID
jgi:hypothetical protein